MEREKKVLWVGNSYEELLSFPKEARQKAGFQLDKVQLGFETDNWKPFDEVGMGVKEIRIRDISGIYRVMYVAKFEEAVYVLHCFQKKTETTSKQDKDIAAARYKAVINKRKATHEH
jgi:phage-related protein